MISELVLRRRKTAGKIVMFAASRSLHHECVRKIEGCQCGGGALMVEVAVDYGQAALLWLKSDIVFWIGRPPGINLGRIIAGFLEAAADRGRLAKGHNRKHRPSVGHITQRCQVLF